MEKLKIGKMAELNGVTEQTLRHYDKMGILKPCYIDSQTGYRYYDSKQSIVLDLIHYMKSMGMSLEEIRNQLNTLDMDYMKSMLHQQISAIDKKIIELNDQKVKISHALDSYYNYENFPPVGTMVYEHIPTRYMLSMKLDGNIYDHDEEFYNDAIRRLGALAAKSGIPFIEFCNVGGRIKLDVFMQQKLESYEVFTFVDPYYKDYPNIAEVPQRTHLSIYCNDLHVEPLYYKILHEEIEKKALVPCGDYLCEDMVNLPFVIENRRTMFIRLQIPIQFPRTTI